MQHSPVLFFETTHLLISRSLSTCQGQIGERGMDTISKKYGEENSIKLYHEMEIDSTVGFALCAKHFSWKLFRPSSRSSSVPGDVSRADWSLFRVSMKVLLKTGNMVIHLYYSNLYSLGEGVGDP